MLDPLSAPLVRLLSDLRLCTPVELQRCARYVRKLASDLPAFDSVWLDALVQARKLTPFQVAILSSDQPQRLRVGTSVLIDRLGGGKESETYLARGIDERELFVMKRVRGEGIRLSSADRRGMGERLQELVGACQGLAHPALAVPQRLEVSNTADGKPGEILIHSRYVPGFHLGELLVRRGRYPAGIVWEMSRQLSEGLAALHRRGVVHGEVRLENLRLMDAGQVLLVDPGVRIAIEPELIPHANIPPETYDTTAPELVGTGQSADESSDLYALGCVLWQLLAGRPPYPTGDPLAKLVAHQTRRIEDVRDWAPETPPALADLIRELTDPDPRARPQSADEVLRKLPPTSAAGKKRVARFLARFKAPSAGGAVDDPEMQVSLQTWGMLLFFIVAGLGVILSDHDSRVSLGEFIADVFRRGPRRTAEVRMADASLDTPVVAEALEQEGSPERESISTEIALMELPEPDQEGVVTLREPGKYRARNYHNVVGPLSIRAEQSGKTTIVIPDGKQGLSISATDIRLEGIALEFGTNVKGNGAEVLLKARAQSVTLVNVRAKLSRKEGEGSIRRTAIAWKGIDPKPEGNSLVMQDCELLGEGAGLYVDGTAHRIEMQNVLKTGGGTLCNIAAEAKGALQSLRLTHVTCRAVNSLMRCQGGWLERLSAVRKKLTIELNDSLVSLSPQEGALIEMISEELPDRWNQSVEIVGENSVSAKGLQIVCWRRGTNEEGEVPPGTNELPLEGLMTGEWTFAGESLISPEDSSVLQRAKIPMTTRSSPGYRMRSPHEGVDPWSLNAN